MKRSFVIAIAILCAVTPAPVDRQPVIEDHPAVSPLLADGNPAPPFPPKPNSQVTWSDPWLGADGNPTPPFPPKPTSQATAAAPWLRADGNPAPPFPPKPNVVSVA